MGYDVYATGDKPYSVRAGNSSEELELALSHIRMAMYGYLHITDLIDYVQNIPLHIARMYYFKTTNRQV